ncbi:MAG: amino acid adenylation domain-containing protein [bacterium]|nr:amino acid adenylation domain-containing protein [bacterium]
MNTRQLEQFLTLGDALKLTDVPDQREKDSTGITFIESGEKEEFLSYRHLYTQATFLLANLNERGLKPGDELLFQFQSQKNFVVTFWACLLGKLIPVPVAFYKKGQLKFLNIWNVLQNPYLVTDYRGFDQFFTSPDTAGKMSKMKGRILYYDDISHQVRQAEPLESTPDDIAFIQFSSGSTGRPKGIINTHRSLLAYFRQQAAVLEPVPHDRFFNWMPLTHDLGLIFFHLFPITLFKPQYLCPTNLFIMRPTLWMSKSADHKITILGSPNFGYRHFLDHFKKDAFMHRRLDSLRLILNGAETISARLCDDFYRELAPYGLNKNVIRPVYGMAETTLIITYSPNEEDIGEFHLHRDLLNIGDTVRFIEPGDSNAVPFVECGAPIGTGIRITDNKNNPLPGNTVGHIKAKGVCVTRGYYNNPEATADTIDADGWLDTGDVGFFTDGRLVFTGRAKEIIISGGQNYYPYDIERLLETIDGIQVNRAAAAGAPAHEAGGEEVLVFVRFKNAKNRLDHFIPIVRQVKDRVLAEMGLVIDHVIPINQIPKTTSGKIQRVKLANDYREGVYDTIIEEIQSLERESYRHHRERGHIRPYLIKIAGQLVPGPEIDVDLGLSDQGFTSLKALRFREKVNSYFNLQLPISLIFDYPTISDITRLVLESLEPGRNYPPAPPGPSPGTAAVNFNEPIAVIGIGCRFPPDADTPEKFWQLLEQGADAVREIPAQRWNYKDFYSEDPGEQGKSYSRHAAFMDHIDGFDSHFFAITPKEAENIDPQQKLLMEVCYQALEHAGIDAKQLNNSDTGVFIGMSTDDYAKARASDRDYCRINAYSLTGSAASTASGRISYHFGLQGPALSVDTACSSSLVAMHNGVRSLRHGECNMALVGGVNLMLTPYAFIALSKLNSLSKTGRCKPFDDNADGYIRGEGCGVILLKRLADAQKENDNILAVIKGSAVNHDGKSSGLTVPNGPAQQKVINRALADAGISPGQVDYVETHGTGTSIGDPQEVNALSSVFSGQREKKLLIGSVKSNIGHLESAAGMAGIIKVILGLQHHKIPASLNIDTPNRHIPWDGIPIAVSDRLTPWTTNGKPRMAGVSAFGISGTNAHVVVEESPLTTAPAKKGQRPLHILTLSTKSEELLMPLARHYKEFLSRPDVPMEDTCYTSNISRSSYNHRLAVVGGSSEDLVRRLTRCLEDPERAAAATSSGRKQPASGAGKIVFMFSGQGSQYTGMGLQLYDTHPLFKAEMDRCAKLFQPYIHRSITRLLYGNGSRSSQVDQARYAQPVIFSIEYALARLWLSWGIVPSAVLGHSIGEYAAACIAGVFDLKEAVRLVAIRGNFMHSLPSGGKMVGILADRETVASLIDPYKETVSIAAVNAPANVTVSGENSSMDKLLKDVKAAGIFTEPLNISHAFHSVLMDSYVETFREEIGNPTFSTPRMTFISAKTGHPVSNEEICGTGYWSTQLRDPVMFYDAISTLEAGDHRLFIEVGGTAALAGLAGQCVQDGSARFIPSLRNGREPCQQLLSGLADLYLHGVDVDWQRFNEPFQLKKTVLPPYPFREKQYPLPTVETPVEETGGTGENLPAEINQMITMITGLEESGIDADANLFAMGMDSLMLVQLKNKIDAKYGVNIEISEFFTQLNTLDRITAFVLENRPAVRPLPSSTTVIRHKPEPGVSKAEPDISHFRGMTFEEDPLTPRQEEFVDQFIHRHTQRTRRSREYAQENRDVLSDWITTLNFRPTLKELVYPIVSDGSEGSKLWDIDGNRYIDMGTGFGVNYFGNRPSFITDALKEQIDKGYELATQTKLAGEVAALIVEMTGVERVTFSNTGTESVMAAVRIARAVTGRKKIVCFAGAYNGSFDGVLTTAGEEGAEPMSPGTPRGMVEDMIVLVYGAPESLDTIRELGDHLAGVLVEPVQSRRPGLQPGEFLEELRTITAEKDIALIFDETYIGFRIHQGGAQAYFGIEADIVLYGKIVGGGLPIGILAGKRKYMDAIDGGAWNYGDDSAPRAKTVFFGGTFCRHPLALTAARAVLTRMKELGPALQEEMNERTRAFAKKVNRFFEEEMVPVRFKYFGSLSRFESFGKYDLSLLPIEMELFFYLLRDKGVYIWEKRVSCFSTQHTEEDLEFVLEAIKESIRELRDGGFSFEESIRPGRDNCFPMSSSQKRMVIISRLKGGEMAYHAPTAYRIDGEVDTGKMADAFKALVQRHEVFRTGLEIRDGELVQVVHDYKDISQSCEIRYRDALTVSDEENHLQQLVEEFIRPFDLARPPLLRLGLFKIAPRHRFMVLDLHHSIIDGISSGIMLQELLQLYRDVPLNSPKTQYRDYARWHNQLLASAAMDPHREYWLAQLAGPLPRPQLPLDFPAPHTNTFDGDTFHFHLGKQQTGHLQTLAAHCHTTLFNVILSAWYILFSKLTGQEDMIIGIPVSTRNETFADTMGLIINSLPLRCRPTGGKPFRSFLGEVRETYFDAASHQEYPFERMAEQAHIRDDVAGNPLFNLIFAYEASGYRVLKTDDLTFRPFWPRNKFALIDLHLEVNLQEGNLYMSFGYGTSLFKRETIQRFAGHYRQLMENIVENPNAEIGQLDLLTHDERHRLLVEFNDTHTPYPHDKTIADLFEEQAQKAPDSIALVSGDTAAPVHQLTYRELNRKAGQLAAYLIHHFNILPDDPVGIMSNRDHWMVTGILGILKSGGAYLPIDPDYPRERIDYMLRDSGTRIVLNRHTPEHQYSSPSHHPTFPPSSPSSLAYIMYTSGSTGQPKGVMVEQRSVVRLVKNTNYIQITPSDRLLSTGPLSFDASTFEIWGSLLNGAMLYVTNLENIINPVTFRELLEKAGITVTWLTAGLFNRMADIDPGLFKRLGVLVVGGDRLSPPHINNVRANCPRVRIINGYGPTENTTFTATCPIQEEFQSDIPIGSPISNTQIHILDPGGHPVPIGVTGELCIAGDGLARGYLNNPELTAEKFERKKFALYHTGDLARWLPGGVIQFIGRRDRQVKIRGFRIELGEVRHRLLQHPDIREAEVTVERETGNQNGGGQKEIIAFLVGNPGWEPDLQDIRDCLARFLPHYMIPARFVPLDALPLTPNGKVDTAALKKTDLESGALEPASGYEAPGNPMEEKLLTLWQEVLGREKIGVNDNFFQLGGHSLKATQLASRLQKEMNIAVELDRFFEFPTIKELASELRNILWVSAPPAPPEGSADNYEEMIL